METVKPRKKPVTYGKQTSTRQLQIYNLLDDNLDVQSTEADKLLTRSLPKSLGQPSQKRSHDFEPFVQIKQDLQSALRSSLSPSSSIQDKSDQTQNGSAGSSVFDLVSSDEGIDRNSDTNKQRKRRKLTPIGRGGKRKKQLGHRVKPRQAAHDPHDTEVATIESIETRLGHHGTKTGQEVSRARQLATPKPTTRKQTPSLRKVPTSKAVTAVMDAEALINVMSMTSSPTPPQTPATKSPRFQRSSSSPSAQLIEQLNRSIALESRTSKQRKVLSELAHHEVGVASPSQLAMRSLRLTPEETTQSDVIEEKEAATPEVVQLTPSRSRRRLVDALDSPRKNPKGPQVIVESPSSSTERSMDDGEESELAKQQEPNIKDCRPVVFAEKTMPGIPTLPTKITYAKQRSHLSDMIIGDMSDFDVPAAAHLAGPMAGITAPLDPSFGSQNSQEEPSKDEGQSTGRIASIHELRQAGMNSRFQSELDSIFEDIEASGRSSKSRKLRGLMLLGEKLVEPSLAQRFVENGAHQRLATDAQKETDTLSSFLTSCVLAILMSSCQASLKTLQQVFEAVMHCAAPLLNEKTELTKFIKSMGRDRKQNLSGATCRDLIDFKRTIQLSQIWTKQKLFDLTPQLIALRSIEIVVRGIREQKDLETSISLPLFEELIAVVEKLVRDDQADLLAPTSTLVLESAISTLEFSLLSRELLDDDYDEAAKKLHILGPLLTKAKVLPRPRHDTIEQLVLRLTLSVTNNNNPLCENLGETDLIPDICDIVRKDFLDLAACADSGKDLDAPKLESVILALGCLINFAECSHSSREAMKQATNATGDGSMVEWLVTAFNIRAGKASEASSLEQTHALVAFSYLSMLICTLCLDDEIRNSVRSGMRSKSLHPLVVTVEEFLNHFRTVEQVMVIEEEASNNFTERFEGLLRALREAEGLP